MLSPAPYIWNVQHHAPRKIFYNLHYCFSTLLFYCFTCKMQGNETPSKCLVEVLLLVPVIIVALKTVIIIMH